MPDARFDPPTASDLSLEQDVAASEMVALVDLQGVAQSASGSFAALFAWTAGSVAGRHVSVLALQVRAIEWRLPRLEEADATRATRPVGA